MGSGHLMALQAATIGLDLIIPYIVTKGGVPISLIGAMAGLNLTILLGATIGLAPITAGSAAVTMSAEATRNTVRT